MCQIKSDVKDLRGSLLEKRACPQFQSPVSERVRAGLRKARNKGKRLGRPRVPVDAKEIQRLRSQGLSLRAIGRKIGVSRTTVLDLLKGC